MLTNTEETRNQFLEEWKTRILSQEKDPLGLTYENVKKAHDAIFNAEDKSFSFNYNVSVNDLACKRAALIQTKFPIPAGNWYSLKNECFYCSKPLNEDTITKDHFWPKSKGGKMLVAACKRCNTSKANKRPDNWINYMKKYPDRFTEERIQAVKDLFIWSVENEKTGRKYFKL